MQIIVFKFTLIYIPIHTPTEPSMAILFSLFERSSIDGPVRPFIYSFTLLQIILPFTFISGAVCMSVCTISISLAILPFTLINLPIGIHESPHTMGLVFLKKSLISASVRPSQNSFAVFHISHPFSKINSPIL